MIVLADFLNSDCFRFSYQLSDLLSICGHFRKVFQNSSKIRREGCKFSRIFTEIRDSEKSIEFNWEFNENSRGKVANNVHNFLKVPGTEAHAPFFLCLPAAALVRYSQEKKTCSALKMLNTSSMLCIALKLCSSMLYTLKH